jgi:hypothetical protein
MSVVPPCIGAGMQRFYIRRKPVALTRIAFRTQRVDADALAS